MNDINTLKLVERAQNGDHDAREKLILNYKPFIQTVSHSVCKRTLNWENDDELSIALIAFNEAINGYCSERGAGFLTFARRIINQRLIDYFRSQGRHRHLSLTSYSEEKDDEYSLIENTKALEDYQLKSEQEDLAEMMLEFDQKLTKFGTSLEELADNCPKHSDTREKLFYVATVLTNDKNLLKTFYRTKKIPAKELSRLAKVSKRVLENGRKYVISLVIILSDERFKDMKTFVGEN